MAEAAPAAKKLGGQGTVKLPAEMFSEPFHNAIVYEAVRAEQLARRRGTASTRTRGEVRGGGAKPWRQKGTGRARAGRSACRIGPVGEWRSAPARADTP